MASLFFDTYEVKRWTGTKIVSLLCSWTRSLSTLIELRVEPVWLGTMIISLLCFQTRVYTVNLTSKFDDENRYF